MNFREGTRRLGLLLGGIGAVIGIGFACVTAQVLWETRTASKQFDSWMSSPIALNIAKAAKDHLSRKSDLGRQVKAKFPGIYDDLADSHLGARVLAKYRSWEANSMLPDPPPGSSLTNPLELDRQSFETSEIIAVNLDGIKEITIDKYGLIQSIHLEEGSLVFRKDPPDLKSYFGLLMLPVFGFFIPWGTVRVLAWVTAGFFQAEPPPP